MERKNESSVAITLAVTTLLSGSPAIAEDTSKEEFTVTSDTLLEKCTFDPAKKILAKDLDAIAKAFTAKIRAALNVPDKTTREALVKQALEILQQTVSENGPQVFADLEKELKALDNTNLSADDALQQALIEFAEINRRILSADNASATLATCDETKCKPIELDEERISQDTQKTVIETQTREALNFLGDQGLACPDISSQVLGQVRTDVPTTASGLPNLNRLLGIARRPNHRGSNVFGPGELGTGINNALGGLQPYDSPRPLPLPDRTTSLRIKFRDERIATERALQASKRRAQKARATYGKYIDSLRDSKARK